MTSRHPPRTLPRFSAGLSLCVLIGLAFLAGCVSSSTLKMKVSQLDESRQEADTQRQEISDLRRGLAQTQQENVALKAKVKTLVEEERIRTLKVDELQTRLRTSQEQSVDLEDRTADLKDELGAVRETLTGQLAEVMERNRILEEENAGLLDRFDRLSRRLEERQGRVDELAATLDGQEADLAAARQLLKEKEHQLSGLTATYEGLMGELKEEIRKGEIEVTRMRGRLTVNVLDRILFSSGRADTNAEGRDVVRRVAGVLKDVEDRQIRVEGHTDNVAISPRLAQTFPSNWELSTARATSIVKTLVAGGVDPSRLSVSGYSEYRPVAPNDTAENRTRNRRIEIVLLPLEDGRSADAGGEAP